MNQYITVGGVRYEYDPDGNLVRKVDGIDVWTYSYDDENLLTQVTTPDGLWMYRYDAFGNRIATVSNGQRIEYLLDLTGIGTVIGEYDESGSVFANYTYGLGLTARKDATGQTFYYDFDALGSSIGLTGSGGNYLNSYSYLPFGESFSPNETITNPFRYVGQWGVATEENGLHFMRARYYDSSVGRFPNMDPIGLLGGDTNLYSYVANDPTNFVDPLGLWGGYGGVVGRITVPALSLEAGGRAILGSEGNEIRGTLVGSAGYTLLAGGVAIGRGWEFGIFRNDVSDFLKSNSINIDTPIGGLSISIDSNGSLVGLGIGGPSWGIGITVIGQDIPFFGQVSRSVDWLRQTSPAPCK
jgi:RHS repeat-associated protein